MLIGNSSELTDYIFSERISVFNDIIVFGFATWDTDRFCFFSFLKGCVSDMGKSPLLLFSQYLLYTDCQVVNTKIRLLSFKSEPLLM